MIRLDSRRPSWPLDGMSHYSQMHDLVQNTKKRIYKGVQLLVQPPPAFTTMRGLPKRSDALRARSKNIYTIYIYTYT